MATSRFPRPNRADTGPRHAGGHHPALLIELAREAGQRVDEDLLTAGDLLRSDEVLVTSTAGGIMPVTVIDGTPVGTGAPGPLTMQLRDRYWASHQDPRYSTPVRYEEPA